MIGLLLASGFGCTPVEHAEEEPPPLGPIAQESSDVNLQISEKGVIRLELNAARMRRYEDPDSLYTIFDNGDDSSGRVGATFFDSLGQQSGTLSAEYVRFDETTREMIAAGDVVVESGEGRRLQTERLVWNEEAGTIEAPGFVSLTADNQNIRGYEFNASEDLLTWTLLRTTGRGVLPE
jgi:LPS export ABC transporter protein LptC